VRILIVTPYLPHAHVGHGGGTAVRQMVRALARRHEVTVLSLRRAADPPDDEVALGAGVRLETVAFRDRSARGLADQLGLCGDRARAAWRAWRTGHPHYVAKYHHPALMARARGLVADLQPDVVQVEYLQLADVALDLARARGTATRPRLVLDSHEHGALPLRRRAATASWWQRRRLEARARAWDRLARRVSRQVDTMLCVTEQDHELLARAGASNLTTVPLGIDTEALQPVRAALPRRQVLFVGSFAHPPNRTAAALLCEQIWPAVRPSLPDWTLVLAGPGSDTFLDQRPQTSAGIEATGFVDDLTELFAESRVFAAPLFEGGGIKIKILEALARGIPVVTTPIGAEGIVTREQDLVGWADQPDTFARVLLDTIEAPDRADERAGRARAHVERHFSWSAVIEKLERIY
jgi:glycosyltransferase involved in cell wall biosynthesis